MAPKQVNKNVLTMNTSRVRRWIDGNGINQDFQDELTTINQQLNEIKHEGRGEAPSDPEEHNAWKNYSSEKYLRLMTAHNVYKDLVELKRIYTAGKSAPSAVLLSNLAGAPARLENESDDDYAARREKYSKYEELTKKTNLNKLASVEKLINTLSGKQNLMLCVRKDELTAQKVRFNSDGLVMLTAACEELVRQCGTHAMKTATQYSRKTIQPSHIIGEGYQELPVFPLLHNLPHFEMLHGRQKRREAHEEIITQERSQRHKKARKRCMDAGRVYSAKDRPDLSDLQSFEDAEVENGFAKKENNTYLWRGIDYDLDDVDRSDFSHYIERLCNQLKFTEVIELQDGSHAEGFKISKSIKEFLSRVVVDFIQHMAPKLRMLIDLSKVKTIDRRMVLTAVQMSLVDLYQASNGYPKWNEDHLTLFNKMESSFKAHKAVAESE